MSLKPEKVIHVWNLNKYGTKTVEQHKGYVLIRETPCFTSFNDEPVSVRLSDEEAALLRAVLVDTGLSA